MCEVQTFYEREVSQTVSYDTFSWKRNIVNRNVRSHLDTAYDTKEKISSMIY